MLIILPVLFLLERFYFLIADRFNIIDKPNQRSSHAYITRRGGGIIFPAAWLIYAAMTGFELPWFTLGLLLIAFISFLDDLKEVAVGPRISSHALALFLAFYDLGIMNHFPWWGMVVAIFFCIAILNAVNFMDGINGITSMYALVFFSLLAVNSSAVTSDILFDLNSPFTYIISSLLVFTFYNFRKKALCFAGDVGSVSIAYLMIGTLMVLIFPSAGNKFSINTPFYSMGEWWNIKYLLLFAVYGVDSLLTIVHRLLLKENILKGHRKHLYQYMANEAGMPHLAVATIYAVIQIPISIWVLSNPIHWTEATGLLICLSGIYIVSKRTIIRNYKNQPISQPAPVFSSSNSGVLTVPDFITSHPATPVLLTQADPEKNKTGPPASNTTPSLQPAEVN